MKHIYKITIITILVFFSSLTFSQSSNYIILHKPFGENSFNSVDVDKNGTIWCGAEHSGLYEFKNNTWTLHQNTNISDFIDLTLDQNNNVWFGSGHNLAEFNGTQLNYFQSSLDFSSNNNTFVQNILINNNGDIWIAGDRTQLAKFDGTNWTTFDSINANIAFQVIRSFAKDSKGNIYFANRPATPSPYIPSEEYQYTLVKYDGQNFDVLTTQSEEIPSWNLHVIIVDGDDHIWFGNKNSDLVEYDSQNFSYYTPPQNMPLGEIRAIVVDNYNQKWLSADSGIYKYHNNQWTEYKYRDLGLINGQPGSDAFDIAVDQFNNLWLATNWGMVQFNPSGIVTGVDDEQVNIPKEFKLSQNYPNPFNPSTTISYQLSATSFVTLKVFDVLGKDVATLVNEEKSAGSYIVNFDAKDLPSGIYFYRLRAGSFVQTKKLVLMK